MKKIMMMWLVISILILAGGCKAPSTTQVPEYPQAPATSPVPQPTLGVQSEDGLFEIKLFEGYKLYYEEPFKHVVTLTENETYFFRIDVLGKELDAGVYKANIMENYQQLGEMVEIDRAASSSPFLQKAEFAFEITQKPSTDEAVAMILAVSKVKDIYFMTTTFVPKGEREAAVTAQMLQMLETLSALTAVSEESPAVKVDFDGQEVTADSGQYVLKLMPGYQLTPVETHLNQLVYEKDKDYYVLIEELGENADLALQRDLFQQQYEPLGEIFQIPGDQLWHPAFKDSGYAAHFVPNAENAGTGEFTMLIKSFGKAYYKCSFYFPMEEKAAGITPDFWNMLATLREAQ